MGAGVGTLAAFILLGVPTAVIPNPFFIRMTPTESFNLVVWMASAPLIGLLVATYMWPPVDRVGHRQAESGAAPATPGGIAAYLAIGCPICNKIVVAALGVSGALNIYAPVQPVIGLGSAAVLGATLAWRLRDRARRCERCAV